MAIFGFIVLTIILLYLTVAAILILICCRPDAGAAKLPVWIISVSIVIVAWWQLIDMAPFPIAFIGGAG